MNIHTHNAQETEAWGRLLGQAIAHNLLIALSGDLGAGKTTFTKGIAAGLGIQEPITSPTFTLINEHWGQGEDGRPRRLVHVDVYRLGDAGQAVEEMETTGFEEVLDDLDAPADESIIVCVVEWAERVTEVLPPDRVEVVLGLVEEDPDARRLCLRGTGPVAKATLAALA